MNEDFVSYEIAKKLKEKGYPLKKVYRQNGAPFFYDLPQDHPDWSQCDAWYLPTISQVLKWLREEKRIDAGAVWDNRDGKWVGYVNEMDMPDLVGEYVLPDTYASYEQAALEGIEYVIDYLI